MRELNFKLRKSLTLDDHVFYNEPKTKQEQRVTATVCNDGSAVHVTIFEDKALAKIAELEQTNEALRCKGAAQPQAGYPDIPELATWLRENSSGVYRQCAEAADILEGQRAAIAQLKELCADALALIVNGPEGCDDDPERVMAYLRAIAGPEEAHTGFKVTEEEPSDT